MQQDLIQVTKLFLGWQKCIKIDSGLLGKITSHILLPKYSQQLLQVINLSQYIFFSLIRYTPAVFSECLQILFQNKYVFTQFNSL